VDQRNVNSVVAEMNAAVQESIQRYCPLPGTSFERRSGHALAGSQNEDGDVIRGIVDQPSGQRPGEAGVLHDRSATRREMLW